MNHTGNLSAASGQASGVGLFGKIPARPDFVRERCGDRASQRFDQWLMKAMETMTSARAALPPVMVRFAFCVEEERTWVVGVLSPSKDQVGRDFPVSVFCRVPFGDSGIAPALRGGASDSGIAPALRGGASGPGIAPALRGGASGPGIAPALRGGAWVGDELSGLPLAAGAFLASAEALIREVPALRAEEVTAHLDQLQPPDASSVSAARARIAEALAQSDARELAERTLGNADGSGPAYGYYTFITAARNALAGSATVLDCPIQIDVDLFSWLAFADRVLRGHDVARSCFWIEEPSARLLLSLGPCSPQLLHFLADPAHGSARLWPLVTPRTEIADQVRAQFAPSMPSLERGAGVSIDQLIEGLVRRSPL